MRIPASIKMALIATLTVCRMAAASVPAAATEVAISSRVVPVTDDFPAKVEKLLGINDNGVEYLPLLVDAIKNQNASADVAAVSINKLVEALNQGPHMSSLLDKLLPLAEIGPKALSFPDASSDWKYGQESQRDRLGDTLWKLALSAKGKDPGRAANLARASLLLAAVSDFKFGWGGVGKVFNQADDPKGLLGLSDEKFDDLQKLIKARGELQRLRTEVNVQALTGIDKITDDKKSKPTSAEISSILGHLDKCFREGPDQSGYRWETIRNTWMFLNLLKSRGLEEGQQAVRAQLQTWKHDCQDPNVTRWIDQALTENGPPPPRLYGLFMPVKQPDGTIKLIEVNPDGTEKK